MDTADGNQISFVTLIVVVEIGDVLEEVGIDIPVCCHLVRQNVVGEFFDFYFVAVFLQFFGCYAQNLSRRCDAGGDSKFLTVFVIFFATGCGYADQKC